jgi:hypothetical protein
VTNSADIALKEDPDRLGKVLERAPNHKDKGLIFTRESPGIESGRVAIREEAGRNLLESFSEAIE